MSKLFSKQEYIYFKSWLDHFLWYALEMAFLIGLIWMLEYYKQVYFNHIELFLFMILINGILHQEGTQLQIFDINIPKSKNHIGIPWWDYVMDIVAGCLGAGIVYVCFGYLI